MPAPCSDVAATEPSGPSSVPNSGVVGAVVNVHRPDDRVYRPNAMTSCVPVRSTPLHMARNPAGVAIRRSTPIASNGSWACCSADQIPAGLRTRNVEVRRSLPKMSVGSVQLDE